MVVHPLNIFQHLIRGWEQVYPYNAAQVMTLRAGAGVASIQSAWHDALASLALGRVRVDRRTFRYELLNGEADCYPVRALPAQTCLASYLSVEMNRPFDDPDEPPFRPFALAGPAGLQLGVVYRHWIADSVAIRSLMRAWCGQLLDANHGQDLPTSRARGYWDLFGPRRAKLGIDETALVLFRNYIRFRTVQKVAMTGVADYPVRVLLRELPTGLIDRVRTAARRSNATVGDVLLASLAQACHCHLPLQRRSSRRDVAIGNIIDLRQHAHQDVSEVFGLFLGFSHVIARREDLNDFPRLVRSISLQNRARRRDGIAQQSLAWLVAASVAHEVGKPEKLYRFYRKELPLAAGLSNVNLAGTWANKLYPEQLIDYLRISPTGPIAPLALSATTLGSRMSLSLTYRPTLLTAADASDLVKTLMDRLAKFAD